LNKKNYIEIPFILLSVIIGLAVSLSGGGRVLNNKLYDILFTLKPKIAEWNKILYVDIDDPTLDALETWPISRYKFAQGISALKDLGAARIILDIDYFNNAPRELNKETYEDIKDDTRSYPLQDVLTNLVVNPDRELARAFAAEPLNVYLSCRGINETLKTRTDISADTNKELEIIDTFFIPLKDPRLTNFLTTDNYMESPVFPLYIGAKGIGSTIAPPDEDGTLRRIALFTIYRGYLVPQLTMPAVMDEVGIDRDKVEIKPGQYIKMTTKEDKTVTVPIDEHGRMYLNWTRKFEDAFGPHISFYLFVEYNNLKRELEAQLPLLNSNKVSEADRETIKNYQKVFEDLAKKLSVVKGRIVIAGLTAEASTDRGMITIDPNAPRVYLEGTIINMFHQEKFLTQLPFLWNLFISIFLVTVIYFFSIRITSALRESITAASALVGVLILEYLFLSFFGIIFNYIMVLTSFVCGIVLFTAYKFISYDRQRNFIKKAFMYYLSPEVVKQVIDNPDLLKLGGERREITAYFSDVAGFTSISEKLSPEEVVTLLNKYLTAMTDIILANDGTVDKYEGDAIIAFFGAPIPHHDHALKCCNAAVDMQNALEMLRKEWIEEGYPPVYARMGLNTGPAIIGNMGSQQRMDYTMMGDTVNTASRFEGANKTYGTNIMISEVTYNQIGDRFVVRKLDLIRVVGKVTPTDVYELVGRTGEVSEEKLFIIDEYHKALQEYRSKKWKDAAEMFCNIMNKYGDPPSKTYYERCIRYMKNPPPADWDGVFVLSQK